MARMSELAPNQRIARQSPWGPLLVADAHVHFFSRRFFELLATQKLELTLESIETQLEWNAPGGRPCSTGRNLGP